MRLPTELKNLLKEFEDNGFAVHHGLKAVEKVEEEQKGVIVWKREVEQIYADNRVYYGEISITADLYVNPKKEENEAQFFEIIENNKETSTKLLSFDDVISPFLAVHHFKSVKK